MFRKLTLALLLSVPFVAPTAIALADMPWPQCFPCDDTRKPQR